jgi:hypothetical protein
MSYAPIELVVINFPGNKFKGEIVPALKDLVNNGIIKIIDIIFAIKDKRGDVRVAEIIDLDEDTAKLFDPITTDALSGLLTPDDATKLAESLDNNSSAGIMLFENTWVANFGQAVANAKGEIMLDERVSRQVVEKLIKEKARE